MLVAYRKKVNVSANKHVRSFSALCFFFSYNKKKSAVNKLINRVIRNNCRGFNNLSYTIHLVLQMQTHVISFYEVTSRVRFMCLPFPQVSAELKVRIRTAIETITADMLQTVWDELDYRVDVCRITKGAHIEHL